MSNELDEVVDEIVNTYIKGQDDIDDIKYLIARLVLDAQSRPKITKQCAKFAAYYKSP